MSVVDAIVLQDLFNVVKIYCHGFFKVTLVEGHIRSVKNHYFVQNFHCFTASGAEKFVRIIHYIFLYYLIACLLNVFTFH